MPENGSIYFASDFHLGVPTKEKSLEREHRILRWLDFIEPDLSELFLMGDIFDFWFEYKHAVPKGYTRLLGRLAQISDAGIPIHFFKGNHDMWTFGYLEDEIGLKVHSKDQIMERQGLKLYLGHGDGLGPGEQGYKLMRSIFRNPLTQWAFARVHPNFGIGLGLFWSRKSRAANEAGDTSFFGEKERILQFAKAHQKVNPMDLYIFGHRHLPLEMDVEEGVKYFNLGDWISYNTYGKLSNGAFSLQEFEKD